MNLLLQDETPKSNINEQLDNVLSYVDKIHKNYWKENGRMLDSSNKRLYNLIQGNWCEDDKIMERTVKKLGKKFSHWQFSYKEGYDYDECPCCMNKTTDIRIIIPEQNTPEAITKYEQEFLLELESSLKEIEEYNSDENIQKSQDELNKMCENQ